VSSSKRTIKARHENNKLVIYMYVVGQTIAFQKYKMDSYSVFQRTILSFEMF
jgi:hypothetical protein